MGRDTVLPLTGPLILSRRAVVCSLSLLYRTQYMNILKLFLLSDVGRHVLFPVWGSYECAALNLIISASWYMFAIFGMLSQYPHLKGEETESLREEVTPMRPTVSRGWRFRAQII